MKTFEDILKKNITVTNWNFLHHVLHSGEVYKQILYSAEEYAHQFKQANNTKEVEEYREKYTCNQHTVLNQQQAISELKQQLSDLQQLNGEDEQRIHELYNVISNISSDERWLEMNWDKINDVLKKAKP
jgi:hypothetical protein